MNLPRFLTQVAWLLAFAPSPVRADPPLTYYDGAIGSTGTALKMALHTIIRNHTPLPYTSTATDTWDALKSLDEDPGMPGNVVLIYSGFSVPKSEQENGATGTWNREHLWPQSFGLVALHPESRARTDLFNLLPIDSTVNGIRGNKYYDFSTAPISIPLEAPSGTYDADSWEPRMEDRGFIARAMFYMAVRYEGSDSDVPNLELAESPNASQYAFGRLSRLLAWNRQYPVTAAERLRNDRIHATYQYNRNPFIDHPEYADMVFLGLPPAIAWKNARFTTTELADPSISGDPADPDRDGLNNLLEYTFNRAPKNSETSSPLSAEVRSHSGFLYVYLSFLHNRYATDVQIRYEQSNNLRAWIPAVAEPVDASVVDFETERITVRVRANESPFFVRLRATR